MRILNKFCQLKKTSIFKLFIAVYPLLIVSSIGTCQTQQSKLKLEVACHQSEISKGEEISFFMKLTNISHDSVIIPTHYYAHPNTGIPLGNLAFELQYSSNNRDFINVKANSPLTDFPKYATTFRLNPNEQYHFEIDNISTVWINKKGNYRIRFYSDTSMYSSFLNLPELSTKWYPFIVK